MKISSFFPKIRIKQYPITDSDNGLAPIRRQAIIRTNDGYFIDALDVNELTNHQSLAGEVTTNSGLNP